MHQRPVTSEDAPLVVMKATTRLMSSGKQGRAKLLMTSNKSQTRARELLEELYRSEPGIQRQRAVELAARTLATQIAQFLPS